MNQLHQSRAFYVTFHAWFPSLYSVEFPKSQKKIIILNWRRKKIALEANCKIFLLFVAVWGNDTWNKFIIIWDTKLSNFGTALKFFADSETLILDYSTDSRFNFFYACRSQHGNEIESKALDQLRKHRWFIVECFDMWSLFKITLSLSLCNFSLLARIICVTWTLQLLNLKSRMEFCNRQRRKLWKLQSED